MVKIKKFMMFVVSILIILFFVLNGEAIGHKLAKVLAFRPEIVIKPSNPYTKGQSYKSFKQFDDSFVPHSYDDLVNIFYTVLDRGWVEFTFYCPTDYESCIDDVTKISYNDVLLSDINNYVHPYNSYSSVKTLYDDTGEVTIRVNHLYSDTEIIKIDKDIDDLIRNHTNPNSSTIEKIRLLHDYIINTNKYDSEKADGKDTPYDSARIMGPLYNNHAICSGYTDLMAVILNKLNVPNFKVASDTHIWNALYINDKWLHLDLTWDDPVTHDGEDILDHSFFLVDSDRLFKLDKRMVDHNFNKLVYQEFN